MKNEHSNKKSNVITLVPTGVQSLLEKFTQSKELTDFLPLIEIVATTSIACPQVWDVWLRLNSGVKASQPTQAILKTIARLSWHQIKLTQKPTTNNNAFVSSHATQNNDSPKSIKSVFKAFEDEENYRKARLTDLDDPYRFFPGAWPFDKIFAETVNFGSDDPGKIISKYLCAFYSKPITPVVADLLIEVRQSSLLCFLKDSLLPWAIAFERRNILNQNTDEVACRTAQLAEIEIFIPYLFYFLEGKIKLCDPSTFVSGFTVRGFAKALPNLPQSMFERLASNIELETCNYALGNSIELGYPELFDVLLSLPLDAHFHSWDVFETEVLPNSFLRQATENIYSIDSLPYLPIHLLSKIIFEFDIDKFITQDAVELNDSNCPWALNAERLRELCVRLIRKITDVRRLRYGGKSPLNYDEAGCLGCNLGTLCDGHSLKIDHDLTYLLSENYVGLGFGGEVSFSASFNASELSSESAKLRTQIYLQVIGLIRKEGWHEFANACLAFYLFSQPIYSKDHQLHADWLILGKIMKAGAGLPGWHVVEKSLDNACALIRKGDLNSLDALCLASWLPHDTLHEKTMPPATMLSSVLNHKQAEQDLMKFLGDETWIKLTPAGKRRLTDADAEWSALHTQLGRGRHDWGPVATAYGKVFEGELSFRMKSVFSSQTYGDYCRNKNRKNEEHITLGPMLHLLKEFTDLDQPLCAEIEKTGIRIQEDKELVKNLLHLAFDRNRGAHPAGLTAKQFVDFRTLIFQGGVLKKFIELL